jgi:pimeloyl-ACP methyl ester carboxylesterase
MGILEHISDEQVVIPEARKRLRKALGADAALESRQVLRIGELPLHCELYESQVDAPLLIFLPGIGTYSELYAQMFAALCQQGFNVLSIDLPGHGYSGGPRGMYTVEQVCQCVTEVLDAVEARYSGPAYLFGYSIGALLAVAAAERDSRISKVICGTLLMTELPPDLFHYMGWQWTWGSGLLFPNMKMPLSVMVDFHQLLAGHPAGELINEDPLLVLDYPFRTLSSLFSHRSGDGQQSANRIPKQISRTGVTGFYRIQHLGHTLTYLLYGIHPAGATTVAMPWQIDRKNIKALLAQRSKHLCVKLTVSTDTRQKNQQRRINLRLIELAM